MTHAGAEAAIGYTIYSIPYHQVATAAWADQAVQAPHHGSVFDHVLQQQKRLVHQAPVLRRLLQPLVNNTLQDRFTSMPAQKAVSDSACMRCHGSPVNHCSAVQNTCMTLAGLLQDNCAPMPARHAASTLFHCKGAAPSGQGPDTASVHTLSCCTELLYARLQMHPLLCRKRLLSMATQHGQTACQSVDSSAQLLSAQLQHEPPGVPEMSVSERPHQDLVEALRVEGIVGDLCRGTDRRANTGNMRVHRLHVILPGPVLLRTPLRVG